MAPRFTPAFRARVRTHVARFGGGTRARAAWEVGITLVLYVAGLAALPWAAELARGHSFLEKLAGAGACVALGLMLVGVYVRTFLLNHDLLHGALFASPRVQRGVALVTGTLSCTTPSVWKREHDRHHRDSNNLDCEQDGQTASWTLARYAGAPTWQRLAYRSLNVPWTMYTVLPLAYFFGFMRVKARLYENVAAALFFAVLWQTGRLGYFFATFWAASVLGFYLFHLQHTFPGVYKRRAAAWSPFDNAMLGSSFLDLPRGRVLGPVLRWFSYGVEYHHVHHLNPRIPGYRLARCHEAGGDAFDGCPRVTLGGGLRTLRDSLYDEARDELTGFPDRRAR